MKACWKRKRLCEIAEIKGGKRVPKGCPFSEGHTCYPYIRVSDFDDNGSIDLKNIQYVERKVYEQLKDSTIREGELFISIAGTIGKTGILPMELNNAGLTENACKLVCKPFIDPKYVYYFTQSIDFKDQADSCTRVTAVPKLAISRLSNISLSIPDSLSEQRRIVACLDQAFAPIRKVKKNAEHNLQQIAEFCCSYINCIFCDPVTEWEEKTLDEICEKITDGTHATPRYLSGGIPFLSVKNLTGGFIDFSETKYISEKEHRMLIRKCCPQKGDILYTKVGTTGIAKVVDTDIDFSIFQSLALLKLRKDLIFNKYLEHYLNSPSGRRQAKRMTRGTAKNCLILRDIKAIKVRFPASIDDQRKIVDAVDETLEQIEELKNTYRQKVANLEELKQSLLQKAFSGEL
jgi:type I restriction enzyme S subunit